MSAVRCSLDPLRDVRHRDARLARDQADWLAWLELGGLRSRTLRDYEWATARLLRAYPSKTLDQITPSDIAHVLRSFPPAGRRTKKAAYDSFFRVEAELRHPCGTIQSYRRGCRCDACRAARRDLARQRKREAA